MAKVNEKEKISFFGMLFKKLVTWWVNVDINDGVCLVYSIDLIRFIREMAHRTRDFGFFPVALITEAQKKTTINYFEHI